ncbi:hypothetical protein F5884DRAFT_309512 [Xylogone sp. PMI_703]|nr:hypothetical protein F5884DRAFT_309512 [Xylogone sp. PMI_703]
MGCKSCRRRHYKCTSPLNNASWSSTDWQSLRIPGDDQQPQCGRCLRAGRSCIRDSDVRFRSTTQAVSQTLAFPSNQIWLPLPPKVDFVDVTNEVKLGIEHIDIAESPSADLNTDESTPDHTQHHWTPKVASSELTESSTIAELSDSEAVGRTAVSPRVTPEHNLSASLTSPRYREFSHSEPIPPARGISRIYLDPPIWPLESAEEAGLLQHFIDNVALFFDFCDQERHFATVVTQRARICRTLLNAILALSARHLSRTTDFSSYAADQYYQKCLHTLIPALDDDATIIDETLFVIVVILRLLEEFDVSVLGSDAQGHLLGAQSLTHAQEKIGMDSSLREAAYWACLRQEIFISLKHQHTVRLNLSLYKRSQAIQPTQKCSWAYSCTFHCAAAVQFAFGDEPRSRYKELMDYNNHQHEYKPESVQPFYYVEADDGGFPDIRYGADYHVMGSQYLDLARILLVTHDPGIPRVGPAHRVAMLSVEEEVRRYIKILCGVALSNPTTPAAIMIACMAISLCGDWFTRVEEQERLYGILVHTEKAHGWPTAGIQKQMRLSWGWTT